MDTDRAAGEMGCFCASIISQRSGSSEAVALPVQPTEAEEHIGVRTTGIRKSEPVAMVHRQSKRRSVCSPSRHDLWVACGQAANDLSVRRAHFLPRVLHTSDS